MVITLRKVLLVFLFLLVIAATLLALKLSAVPVFFKFGEEPTRYDLLIKEALVIDGSGDKGFEGDIGIIDKRITAVGDLNAVGDVEIDSSGLVAAPGFINPHSHVDQIIEENPDAAASLLQGVTTEIVGMDGQSALDLDKHFKHVISDGIAVNYGSMVGQGSVRRSVVGENNRRASQNEINTMKSLVEQAMEQGAFGLSTGLEYVPGIYTPTEEIIELAKAAAPYNGIYASHIRNESDRIVSAVREALDVGRKAGTAVVISHIKVGTKATGAGSEKIIMQNTAKVISLIEEYRQSGGKVYADLYPYRVPWFQINRKLNEVFWQVPDSRIIISRSSKKSYVGKTLAEAAEAENIAPGVLAQRLIADPETRVCVLRLSEDSIRTLLQEDFTMVSMDNNITWDNIASRPPTHPRNYGTYPRVLGKYVRENKVLTLEQAVHKMTGLTASVYGIDHRGLIKEGYFADIVIFDPKRVNDRATYWKPEVPPAGIIHVLVNGRQAVRHGEYIYVSSDKIHPRGVRSGMILKKATRQ